MALADVLARRFRHTLPPPVARAFDFPRRDPQGLEVLGAFTPTFKAFDIVLEVLDVVSLIRLRTTSRRLNLTTEFLEYARAVRRLRAAAQGQDPCLRIRFIHGGDA